MTTVIIIIIIASVIKNWNMCWGLMIINSMYVEVYFPQYLP